MQYLVTTIVFFFLVGGFLALLFRAELAQPGDQYFNPQTFNVLISNHAALMIFLFVIPGFAGARQLRHPADDRRRRHGVPEAERALVLAAADRRGRCCSPGWSRPAAGRRPAGRATRRSARTSRWGRCSSTWRVQWAGASSIMTALNFLVTIITMRAPGMTFWRMPLLVWANFSTSTARRARDAVHRRLAVLRHVRPRDAHELLRDRARRLRRSATSTSSGSTRTRPSTS